MAIVPKKLHHLVALKGRSLPSTVRFNGRAQQSMSQRARRSVAELAIRILGPSAHRGNPRLRPLPTSGRRSKVGLVFGLPIIKRLTFGDSVRKQVADNVREIEDNLKHGSVQVLAITSAELNVRPSRHK